MASLPPDPWKALGVDKNADKAEIRTAYKKLVLKCHPDKVQDPTLKQQKQDEFQKVQQAYELLNDDAERIKYEEQVKLMELRKQAAMMAKNMPNSSASRNTPPRHYEIRTKTTTTSTPSSGAKPYVFSSVHARSHEEMSSRIYFDDGEKHARRTASYEKPTYRDDDRRDSKDDRRRSRKEEDDFRIKSTTREREIREKERELRDREKELREREREKEREREYERDARKADRKRSDRERDKEKRRGVEDKHRRYNSPYIEENEPEDQPFSSSKTEKKRSPSKKPFETREAREPREREREREKSQASRRAPSPHVETVQPPMPPPAVEPEYLDELDKAATYIERSRRHNPGFAGRTEYAFAPPVVPTPPPAEIIEEDLVRLAAARATGRRASHEGSKSREKLPSSHKPYVVDASPKSSSRGIPTLHKSHTSPLTVPIESSSPPRIGISRATTTPHEFSTSAPQMPPNFSRTHTWTHGQDVHDFYAPVNEESDEDRAHRHSRRGSSRRHRSPDTTRYKVEGSKTSKLEARYGESPTSTRYAETYEYVPTGSSYPGYMKVKEARSYGPSDVKYSDYNVSYATRGDQYSQVYA